MAAFVTIRTRTNADWARAFIYSAGAGRLPLTGATLRLQVRADAAAVEALELNTGALGGIEVTDPAQGEFTITFQETRLSKLNPGEYVLDCIAVFDDGRTELLFEGKLIHARGVTR